MHSAMSHKPNQNKDVTQSLQTVPGGKSMKIRLFVNDRAVCFERAQTQLQQDDEMNPGHLIQSHLFH